MVVVANLQLKIASHSGRARRRSLGHLSSAISYLQTHQLFTTNIAQAYIWVAGWVLLRMDWTAAAVVAAAPRTPQVNGESANQLHIILRPLAEVHWQTTSDAWQIDVHAQTCTRFTAPCGARSPFVCFCFKFTTNPNLLLFACSGPTSIYCVVGSLAINNKNEEESPLVSAAPQLSGEVIWHQSSETHFSISVCDY